MEEENKKKILVVEDDEDFLSILKKVFGLEGFLVFSANDGASAVKEARGQNFDLIVSDVLMPKMDGLEMAKQIRQLGVICPIIFLTNAGLQERVSSEFDYFTKSETHLDDLVVKIKEKLGINPTDLPPVPVKM